MNVDVTLKPLESGLHKFLSKQKLNPLLVIAATTTTPLSKIFKAVRRKWRVNGATVVGADISLHFDHHRWTVKDKKAKLKQIIKTVGLKESESRFQLKLSYLWKCADTAKRKSSRSVSSSSLAPPPTITPTPPPPYKKRDAVLLSSSSMKKKQKQDSAAPTKNDNNNNNSNNETKPVSVPWKSSVPPPVTHAMFDTSEFDYSVLPFDFFPDGQAQKSWVPPLPQPGVIATSSVDMNIWYCPNFVVCGTKYKRRANKTSNAWIEKHKLKCRVAVVGPKPVILSPLRPSTPPPQTQSLAPPPSPPVDPLSTLNNIVTAYGSQHVNHILQSPCRGQSTMAKQPSCARNLNDEVGGVHRTTSGGTKRPAQQQSVPRVRKRTKSKRVKKSSVDIQWICELERELSASSASSENDAEETTTDRNVESPPVLVSKNQRKDCTYVRPNRAKFNALHLPKLDERLDDLWQRVDGNITRFLTVGK